MVSGVVVFNFFQYEGLEYVVDGQVWIVEVYGRIFFFDDQGEIFID